VLLTDDKVINVLLTGDSTCGQRALYPTGMTGIPIYNVNNNCATGSTALHLANQFVAAGQENSVDRYMDNKN
jgi:acetyl-CoA acetyltransferase